MASQSNEFELAPSRSLLRSDVHDEYDRKLSRLWGQSVRLHANIHLMEKISGFPFDLFGDVDNLCWKLFFESLYDSSVMAVWRIACDNDGKSLTIRGFRKWLIQNGNDESSVIALRRGLGRTKLRLVSRESTRRLNRLRHAWLAHLENLEARNDENRPGQTVELIKLDELQHFGNAIHEDILLLGLGTHRLRTYHEYDESIGPSGDDARTDIERLLDLVALHSDGFRMPEDQKGYWPTHRTTLSERQIKVFDAYRVRLGNTHSATGP